MRDAAVGFHCPECVREGSKSVREARTAFGGRLGAGGQVTYVLLGLNVVVFLLDLVLRGQRDLVVDFGNLGLALGPDGPIGAGAGEYYRLLTAAFLHANVLHLVLNMGALMMLGPAIEEQLGRVRFLALYLLSALGGSVASLRFSDPGQLGVGASGAIFGLFCAQYLIARRLGGDTAGILGIVAVNLVIGFVIPVIDWRAHLGGLVVGGLVTAVYAMAPRGRERSVVQAAGCVLVLLLLVALVVLRVGQLNALI